MTFRSWSKSLWGWDSLVIIAVCMGTAVVGDRYGLPLWAEFLVSTGILLLILLIYVAVKTWREIYR